MTISVLYYLLGAAVLAFLTPKVRARLRLSRAKHPTLQGHASISLRAQGLALSRVGSGRLIFSHNFTDKDFDAVMERIVSAAAAMKADGWWWRDPDSGIRAIKRQVLREIVATLTRASRFGSRWDGSGKSRSSLRTRLENIGVRFG